MRFGSLAVNTRDQPVQIGRATSLWHLLALALLASVYVSAELGRLADQESAFREAVQRWHCLLGVSLMLLALVPLASFALGKSPFGSSAKGDAQELVTRGARIALLVLMLAMPLLGWLYLGARGQVLPIPGLQLTRFLGPDIKLAQFFGAMHQTGSALGYILLGFYALNALIKRFLGNDRSALRLFSDATRRPE
jgi:cytochrome b561